VTDKNSTRAPQCQEVQAPPVDALVEQQLLEALAPDQIALAVAAVEELEVQGKQLEQQWVLKRERARYEAERARRQYDAVEPENRLVARSLERVWEQRLRQLEVIEQEYDAWRRERPASTLSEAERAEVLCLAQDLPRVWRAASPEERKRILRLVVREVVLDQKREKGMVWLQLCWQTGAISEHRLQRHVQSYNDCATRDLIECRIRELNAAGKLDHEIAAQLNAEGIMSARGVPFENRSVFVLRHRWHIPSAKINGAQKNPLRWPDGTYSAQGAAAALGISLQTVLSWLRNGRLQGHQLARGHPWQITLPSKQLRALRAEIRRINRPKREAS
jgi:hypothetical protein